MNGPEGALEQLLAAKEIAVFCGSGGVGKTSVAAAAALGAVNRLGGKVLVLTIDPARRLADALGLEASGNVARPVPLDVYRALGAEPRGHRQTRDEPAQRGEDDQFRMSQCPAQSREVGLLEKAHHGILFVRNVFAQQKVA